MRHRRVLGILVIYFNTIYVLYIQVIFTRLYRISTNHLPPPSHLPPPPPHLKHEEKLKQLFNKIYGALNWLNLLASSPLSDVGLLTLGLQGGVIQSFFAFFKNEHIIPDHVYFAKNNSKKLSSLTPERQNLHYQKITETLCFSKICKYLPFTSKQQSSMR